VLLFGRGRNKGVFVTNQEGDTSAYHLNLTFLKNIQLHLIIPNLIKNIYIKKLRRPNMRLPHRQRPNAGATPLQETQRRQPTNSLLQTRTTPHYRSPARPTLPVFVILGFSNPLFFGFFGLWFFLAGCC
jgi:hypothetical protein